MRPLAYGDFDTMDVLANAVTPGPFLVGDKFTAADVVVGSTLRWGTIFKLFPERPEFADYVARFRTGPPRCARRRRMMNRRRRDPPSEAAQNTASTPV